MHATIWHNPACGTSRNTLALLQEAGAEVTVIEYLKTPPSATKLAQLYRDAAARNGVTPAAAGASAFETVVKARLKPGEYYRTPAGAWAQK